MIITAKTLTTYRAYVHDHEHSDAEITRALIEADRWVEWKRYSVFIVAHNILKDGYPHP